MTWFGTQRSGQLIASSVFARSAAAIIRSASASDAANGFSTSTLTPAAASRSVHSACLTGRRAEDRQIGLGPLDAGPPVGEHSLGRNAEILDGLLHPLRLLVVDADDLGMRMIGRHAQQIAHVHVVERDADDPPFLLFSHRLVGHAVRAVGPSKLNRQDAKDAKTTSRRLTQIDADFADAAEIECDDSRIGVHLRDLLSNSSSRPWRLRGSSPEILVQLRQSPGVLVVGRFEQFIGSLGADDRRRGEHARRVAGLREPRCDFRLEAIDQQAAADRRSRRDRAFQVLRS